MIDELAKED